MSPTLRIAVIGTALAVVGVTVASCADATGSPAPQIVLPTPAIRAVCSFSDPRLTEISGLATSIRHPNTLWTHNDSGDTARIFAVDATTCEVQSEVDLKGVAAVDIEAIAVGRDKAGEPVIWVGDIGDNYKARESVALYELPEPTTLTALQSVEAQSYAITYADGPHDAEGLLVTPTPGGPVYIVTKRLTVGAGFYSLPKHFASDDKSRVVARKLGRAPIFVTDASYAPNGQTFVTRGYFSSSLYVAPPPGSSPKPVMVPLQAQGEAITYGPDSNMLYFAGEGENSTLFAADLPTK